MTLTFEVDHAMLMYRYFGMQALIHFEWFKSTEGPVPHACLISVYKASGKSRCLYELEQVSKSKKCLPHKVIIHDFVCHTVISFR